MLPHSPVVVVGMHRRADTIIAVWAIGKELNVQLARAYDPQEFSDSPGAIAEGDIDVGPVIAGKVGIDDVPEASEGLADPEQHRKILVVPRRGG